ncbi:MAG: DUF2232 domain-containing protein [Coriobacteriia bacterium]|nr:DUF2232 domain-containing protein [Coriobacteriia bacterium]
MARAAGRVPTPLGVRAMVPLVLAVLFGALSTVLFHTLIGLPIAGAALAALVYGDRAQVSVAMAVIGGALTGVLASATVYVVVLPLTGVATTARAPYVFMALAVASLVAVGPVTAVMMRRRSALEVAFVLTAALTGLQLAALASLAAGAGVGLGEYIAGAAGSLAEQSGMGEEFGATLASMWPGAAVAMNGLTSMLVVAGVGVAGARFGISLRKMPALPFLDLDPRMVVLPIAAIALIAAGRLPVEAAPSLEIVGKNLLVVARWVFFLQGIAVFAGLYERAKLARPVRAIGFVILGVTEAFVPAVSITGLADIWLNLRRLQRDAAAPGPPGAESGRE